ncbi:MAG: helix-turn-helix domain-containing protein [Trebonia sp.]|jgi:DNA-binding transcriptional ArsR family regulator
MPSEDSQPPRPSDIREITDARSLRALTHPVRVALIEELVHGGAMTATELGERIGETPTTCSFHLRQLAKYGFVEEAGGGQGRSRPWRMTGVGWSFSPDGNPAAELASEAALRLFRERSFARYETWRRTRGVYSPQWREASEDSEYLFYLNAEELAQLGAELREVLMRWRQFEGRVDDPARRPPDSLPVETLLFSFPIEPPPAAPPAAPPARPADTRAEDG